MMLNSRERGYVNVKKFLNENFVEKSLNFKFFIAIIYDLSLKKSSTRFIQFNAQLGYEIQCFISPKVDFSSEVNFYSKFLSEWIVVKSFDRF